MDLKTLGEHFDKMILLHESADTTQPGGLRRLAVCREPTRRILPGLHRQMGKVDPYLVATFRRLVVGATPWPLFIHGGVGTGKTLAALSLADFSTTACYWTVETLCDDIMDRETHSGAGWDLIAQRDLAILDELGERTNVGDLQYTTVKKFLDQREQKSGRVGIYISNLTPDELVQMFDRRIVSRLTAGTTVKLTGEDQRSAESRKAKS